jgi:hypothetical protein
MFMIFDTSLMLLCISSYELCNGNKINEKGMSKYAILYF